MSCASLSGLVRPESLRDPRGSALVTASTNAARLGFLLPWSFQKSVTSLRFGLAEMEMRAWPASGSVFVVDRATPGLPANVFRADPWTDPADETSYEGALREHEDDRHRHHRQCKAEEVVPVGDEADEEDERNDRLASGSATRRNVCSSLAPSARAASSRPGGKAVR